MSPPASPPWHQEARDAALAEANRWHGTPHANRIAKVGTGIDCLGFIREIAVAAGVLPAYKMPYYDPAWGVGRTFNVIERVLVSTCHATRHDPSDGLAFGDVVIFSVGRQSNHVGIILDGELWHCQASSTVQPEPITDSLLAQLQSVVRLTAAGFRRRPEDITTDELKP